MAASHKRDLTKGIFLVTTNDRLFCKHKVSLANALVMIENGETRVQLCNFSQTPVTLMCGVTVESFENKRLTDILTQPVESNQSLGIKSEQNYAKDEDLTENLEYFESKLKVGTQLNKNQREKLLNLLISRREAFALGTDEIGFTHKFEHKIDTGDSPPIAVAPYRQSPEKRKKTNQLVQELLDTSIIEPSCSPWASPIVLVKKKTGDWRFCVDYRKLNGVTKKDHYPLPNINDALDYLSGASIFTSLDLKSGYYQIGISEKDKEKTSFVILDGLYQFKVMPFGLTNAPATFQRCMDVVLSGLKYMLSILG